MSFETVKQYFKTQGLEERIHQFDVSSATVELAAKALQCEEKRIAKTLSFKIGQEAMLIVTAGDAKIDNAKFKVYFHTKAKMLAPEEVEKLTGHPVGGVCPFSAKEDVAIYLDTSLKRFETIYPACGSSNSAIELSIEELEQYSHAKKWIDVCKNWKEEEE